MTVVIGVPREENPIEKRVALTPEYVARLTKNGAQVLLEKDPVRWQLWEAGAFEKAGAKIASRKEVLASDIVLRINEPELSEIQALKPNSIHISFLNPFQNPGFLSEFAKHNIKAISLEMIPRTTRAQKMDVLSSQASLAGYVAVILASDRLQKILPLMMTPAGTLSPAKVFIIGAGVAGLQAIATAKRLGARVEAFDTRPAAEEQVLSLGAKFVKIDLGERGEVTGGYAKALDEAQLAKQREVMSEHCRTSDIVITTAQVFGKKAPQLITKAMIQGMKPGSIIVDLAVESGGNVEGITFNEETLINGVRLIGLANLPGRVALDASQMLASNLTALLEEYWNKETNTLDLHEKHSDDILSGCLMTLDGKIIHPSFQA